MNCYLPSIATEAHAGGGDIINQEDIPTVVDQTEEKARLSEADSDQGWSSHTEPSPIQGTEKPMSIDCERQIRSRVTLHKS